MKISEMRKKAGFPTQRELANSLGVNRGMVAKWEVGLVYPHASMLPKIAALLNVSEGEIIAAITAARG